MKTQQTNSEPLPARAGSVIWMHCSDCTTKDKCAAMGGCDNELVVMVPESEFVSTKYWCAMCGKWGDHQSGTCPQLHSQNIETLPTEGAAKDS